MHLPHHVHPTDDCKGASLSRVPGLPPVEELLWGQREVWRGEQRIYGQVVPRDPAVIMQCRQQMFNWFMEGHIEVRVWGETRVGDGQG